MNPSIQNDIWRQFGASIDMLENAITMCPNELWDNEHKFWYNAYHCLFWLDYYLTGEPQNFVPPPPFTLSEFDPSGKMPERTFSKKELLSYLEYCRKKCRQLIGQLTNQLAKKRWVDDYKNYSIFEIVLYNMRHVQHHTAQLNLLLRQQLNQAPKWVSVASKELKGI